NALASTPSGGRVTVGAVREGERVLISVADTGPGIGPDRLPHIFERFYRAGEGARGAGLGLGLPISRQLARAMGGDISVTSVPGEGATFVVSLPA
ncbi:MAG: ATP-binding protein, partial [Gaiellales bacterium]